MIPVLYDGGAIDPRRLGKGKLSDIISCVVHEELNGDFSMTFQYPITGVHYDEMTIGSSIIVNMPCFNASSYHSGVPKSSESGTENGIQVFDIYKKSTPIDGVVTFYCQSIAWRLKDIVFYKSTWQDGAAGLANLLKDSVPVTLDSGKISLDNVQFDVVLPYAAGQTTTYSNSAPKSALSMFLGDSESVVSSMGWDIAYKCIIRDPAPTYPLRVQVYALMYGRGEDYGVIIRHGYRLTDVEYDDDSTDTFNAVVPYWDDGSGTKTYVTGYVVQPTTPITPIKAVPMDCTQAFQTQPTGAQLTQYAQDWLDTNTPWVNVKNITLDFINGSEISGVNATINLGDTVRIYWPAADINIKLRAIAYDYDILAERYNSIELGKQQDNFVSVTGIDGGSGASGGASGGGVSPYGIGDTQSYGSGSAFYGYLSQGNAGTFYLTLPKPIGADVTSADITWSACNWIMRPNQALSTTFSKSSVTIIAPNQLQVNFNTNIGSSAYYLPVLINFSGLVVTFS